MKKLAGLVSSLGIACLILSGCAADRDSAEFTLHYTTYSAPNSDQSRTVQRWAEDVSELTDGNVEIKFHYSQSLVGAEDAVQATLDGRADIAQVGSIYASSDLPMYTVVELPFQTENTEAHMRSIQRLYFDSEEYRENFEEQGVQQLFPLPLGNAVLGSNEPVNSADDLSGLTIRGGGLLSRVLLDAGANPVAMTANDIYESMQRGVVDGYTSLGLSNLDTFGLADASPYLASLGVGAYSSSIVVINEQVFDSLPEDYQNALLQASEQGIEYGLEEMSADAQLNCEIAIEAGAELSSFPEADVEALSRESALEQQWVNSTSERGYASERVLATYQDILSEEEAQSTFVDPFTECLERG